MRGTISKRSSREPVKSARRLSEETMMQPDALGLATRLAAGRLRAAGILLKPLLEKANLSSNQIDKQDTRIGVTSQIKFLEIAAKALNDSLLGFNLAREGDLRQMGLLYYAAASSETLGDALDRAQRYSSIANESVVLKCFESDNFRISLSYIGVTRILDRQYMEFLTTTIVRVCRVLTNRRLMPMAVGFAHQRLDSSSELEKFFGCRIEFGADDEVIFQKKAAQLHVAGADPYLSEILLHNCDQALARRRRSDANSLRTTIENVVAPLLPHGSARLAVVSHKLGLSRRSLERRLSAEGLSFGEILNQLRSDLASHYLSQANLSVSQIAWLVGYRGIEAFSHAYKRWTGVSPKKMRYKLGRSLKRERKTKVSAIS